MLEVKQHAPKCLLTHLRQQSSLSVENSTLSQNTLTRLSRSAIGQHLLESQLCADHFSTNQFEILERAWNMLQLHVLEALHIHFGKPELCQQKNCHSSWSCYCELFFYTPTIFQFYMDQTNYVFISGNVSHWGVLPRKRFCASILILFYFVFPLWLRS